MSNTSYTDALVTRYKSLAALKARVDCELDAVANGLRVAGLLPPLRGRPRVADPYSEEEAREFHRRHVAGERSDEVLAGERQYQRQHKRRRRLELKDAS